ncbi:MAG: SMC-Scp complex subunit ScpB [Planctomycetota bacterium]
MSENAGSESAAEQDRRPALKRIVEALLFSSERPIRSGRLAEIAGAEDGHAVRAVVRELQAEYEERGHAFRVEEIAGGFQLLTRPEFAEWVSELADEQERDTLSQAALETLAVVAYRQPIMRAEVEDIRGVGCGHMLRSLVDKRLIRVVGRADEVGRPLLYGTTRQFLEAFGLNSIEELPKKSEFGLPRPDEEEEGRNED